VGRSRPTTTNDRRVGRSTRLVGVLAALACLAALSGPAAAGGDPAGLRPQVVIETRLVETSRDAGRALGFDPATEAGAGAPAPGSGRGAPPSGPDRGPGFVPLPEGRADPFEGAGSDATPTRVLASPRILTRSGQAATIRLVDDLHVPASGGGAGVDFPGFGLELHVTPHVTPDGAVRLEIRASVDELVLPDEGPPRSEPRGAETSIQIPDGGTVLLAGLLGERSRTGAGRVPLLGDLPGLGRLFRSDPYRAGRTDLFLLVTPTIRHEGEPRGRPARPGTPDSAAGRTPTTPHVDPNLRHGGPKPQPGY